MTKIYGIRPATTIIRKYGYEYHLVEVDRGFSGIRNPCFMEHQNMALVKVVKINLGIPNKKKK